MKFSEEQKILGFPFTNSHNHYFNIFLFFNLIPFLCLNDQILMAKTKNLFSKLFLYKENVQNKHNNSMHRWLIIFIWFSSFVLCVCNRNVNLIKFLQVHASDILESSGRMHIDVFLKEFLFNQQHTKHKKRSVHFIKRVQKLINRKIKWEIELQKNKKIIELKNHWQREILRITFYWILSLALIFSDFFFLIPCLFIFSFFF